MDTPSDRTQLKMWREGGRGQFTGPGGAAAARSRKVSPRRGSENGNSESARADTSEGTGCGKASMLVFGALEATLFCKKTVEGMGFQEIAQQPLGELHSQPPLAGQLFFQEQWETLKGVSEDLFQKDHGVIY